MKTIDFDALEVVLAAFEHTAEAAEVHGTLCGLAGPLGEGARPYFVTQTLGEADNESTASQALYTVLETLTDETLAALTDTDFNFELLLPADSAPVKDRLEALSRWSAGFLHGLAMALSIIDRKEALDEEPLSEIVADVLAISQVDTAEIQEEDADEFQLEELVEYLRVATQLSFESLTEVRPAPRESGESLH